jgi:hypothetical protein
VKGVFYLHQITTKRGRPENNFKSLKAQAPDLKAAPVILVTTDWRGREEDRECLKRMEDLTVGWTSSNEGPSPVAYDDSDDSAWRIFESIAKYEKKSVDQN